jgi:hypothetical protein
MSELRDTIVDPPDVNTLPDVDEGQGTEVGSCGGTWRQNTDHRVEIMALFVGQLSVDR